MAKHRAVIVGAGRIGAGYNWHDDAYTHAGAYMALKDRVELVGFVEKDEERGKAAVEKWSVPYANTITAFSNVDIVSVCVQPEQQRTLMAEIGHQRTIKGAWVEKPWVSGEWSGFPVQVNYQRRADSIHRMLSGRVPGAWGKLVVYGKDDETTRCHFRDLSRFWNVPLDYRPFNGPCAYALDNNFFDNGGIDSAECFKGMLGNLLDAVEGKAELWSPPYTEEK